MARYLILVACVWLTARPAAAEGWSQAAAVDHALSRHPTTRSSAHTVEAARSGVDRAESAWLPRVAAFGRAGVQGPVPTLTMDTGITPPGAPGPLAIKREIGQRFTGAVGVEAGWRALDFGARSAQGEAAEAGVDVAREAARVQAVALAWSVRQSYAAAAFAAEMRRVTAKALSTAKEAWTDVEARRDVGMAADIDVAAAASRVADLEARLADAEARTARAQESLRLLLDAAAGEALALTDSLETLAGAPRAPAAQGSPPAQASPEEARLRAAARARERQRRAVERTFWPTLDLTGTAAWQDPQTFVDTDSGPTWMLGAKITWPVFDGTERRHHAEGLEAEAAALSAGADAAAERRETARADAAGRYYAARGAAEAAVKRIAAAKVYMKAAQAGEAAGMTTHLDLERAADRLDAARLALTQARFEAARARADRLRADGVSREDER